MTPRHLHLALAALGAALPLGEGAAWLALGAVAACMAGLSRRHGGVHGDLMAASQARVAAAGLLLWAVGGLAAAPLSGLNWLRPGELLRWAPLLALPLVAAACARAGALACATAARAFLVSLGVAALFGLLQYGLDIRPGEALMRPDAGWATQALVPGSPRAVAGGFYFHRLKLAHVLLIGIAGVVARLLLAPLRGRQRAAAALLLALFVAALAATFARAAAVGCAIGIVALGPWAPWRWRALGLGLAAALAATALLRPELAGSRLASIVAPAAPTVRATLWSHALAALADHRGGVGLGNYSQLVGRHGGYYDADDPDIDVRTYPHSVVLAAWAEAGPLGLIGTLLFWGGIIASCVAALAAGRAPAPAAAGLAGTVALWTVGLTHDVLFHGAVALTAACFWGWTLAQLAPEAWPAAGSPPAAAPPLAASPRPVAVPSPAAAAPR